MGSNTKSGPRDRPNFLFCIPQQSPNCGREQRFSASSGEDLTCHSTNKETLSCFFRAVVYRFATRCNLKNCGTEGSEDQVSACRVPLTPHVRVSNARNLTPDIDRLCRGLPYALSQTADRMIWPLTWLDIWILIWTTKLTAHGCCINRTCGLSRGLCVHSLKCLEVPTGRSTRSTLPPLLS